MTSRPTDDKILCGDHPKTERPKSLDLSGGQRGPRLNIPHHGTAKQHLLASDRLHGVEEEDTDTENPQTDRTVSNSAGTVKRTGIEMGFDPLSSMTIETVQLGCENSSSAATSRRDLAEEIETYMNNGSSPLNSRAPSVDLQSPSSPLLHSASTPHASPRPSTLLRANTNLALHVKPRERMKLSPSLPLGNRDRERPSSLVSPSSPTPSTSSFSMDSLFTPTLDIFKSSVISAGKGVAEKASRLYSRLSSQTSLTQVGSRSFSLN